MLEQLGVYAGKMWACRSEKKSQLKTQVSESETRDTLRVF
jgi:hypothetical protein